MGLVLLCFALRGGLFMESHKRWGESLSICGEIEIEKERERERERVEINCRGWDTGRERELQAHPLLLLWL